jgi:hypothetical protein
MIKQYKDFINEEINIFTIFKGKYNKIKETLSNLFNKFGEENLMKKYTKIVENTLQEDYSLNNVRKSCDILGINFQIVQNLYGMNEETWFKKALILPILAMLLIYTSCQKDNTFDYLNDKGTEKALMTNDTIPTASVMNYAKNTLYYFIDGKDSTYMGEHAALFHFKDEPPTLIRLAWNQTDSVYLEYPNQVHILMNNPSPTPINGGSGRYTPTADEVNIVIDSVNYEPVDLVLKIDYMAHTEGYDQTSGTLSGYVTDGTNTIRIVFIFDTRVRNQSKTTISAKSSL